MRLCASSFLTEEGVVMQRSKSLAMVFLLGVFLAGGAAGFAANQVTTPK